MLSEIDSSKTAPAQQEAQAEKHHRKGQRRALNQPRRQRGNRQNAGDAPEELYGFRPAAPCRSSYPDMAHQFGFTIS